MFCKINTWFHLTRPPHGCVSSHPTGATAAGVPPYLDLLCGCIVASSSQDNQLRMLILLAHSLFREGQQGLLFLQIEQSRDSVSVDSCMEQGLLLQDGAGRHGPEIWARKEHTPSVIPVTPVRRARVIQNRWHSSERHTESCLGGLFLRRFCLLSHLPKPHLPVVLWPWQHPI